VRNNPRITALLLVAAAAVTTILLVVDLGRGLVVAAVEVLVLLAVGVILSLIRPSRARRLALALDAANDGIWDIDVPSGDFYASDRFAAILGYTSDEKPRSMDEVGAMLEGVDTVKLARMFGEERSDGREASFEARLRRKDGSLAWVEIRGRTVERLPDGRPLRMVGVISDITARKQAEQELRQVQDRALQTEKLASLGRLVAGLAHELNSPLGALVSSSDLTVRSAAILRDRMGQNDCNPDPDSDPRLQRALAAIEQSAAGTAAATARLDELLSGLKRFSALDRAELQEVDLHELLDTTVTVLGEAQWKDIEIVREYADLPRVLCNPARLNQLILAVVRNAVEAMDGAGILTLQTEIGSDDTVHVTVVDNGRGISAVQLASVFEPGIRTGSDRVHLGWGLAAAARIAEEHGGRIEAASEIGRGSRFTVILPVRPQSLLKHE